MTQLSSFPRYGPNPSHKLLNSMQLGEDVILLINVTKMNTRTFNCSDELITCTYRHVATELLSLTLNYLSLATSTYCVTTCLAD